MSVKVGVIGALGKMGREIVNAVLAENGLDFVCAVDLNLKGEDIGTVINNKPCGVLIESDLDKALETSKPDVVIDFTQPSVIFENAKKILNKKIKMVIGTTGLKDDQLDELKNISEKNNTGCLIAPNFSIGAVLLMMFSEQAAKYFDNAEIIELHHNQKKDAPSGTAIKTAKMMAEVKNTFTKDNCPEVETIEGARGGNSYADIKIHSVRMPGYIASQEVLFGSQGQIFTMRHDSMNRTCYMSGIMLATKYIAENNKFVYGLEKIL